MTNDPTLTALNGSIAKWYDIAYGGGVDNGEDNCPLCGEFQPFCYGCPVMEDTGQKVCRLTPYQLWAQHQSEVHGFAGPWKVNCDECAELAHDELDYLRVLRVKYLAKQRT
jgi:hypothetical protein